jgi:hypothetical protein
VNGTHTLRRAVGFALLFLALLATPLALAQQGDAQYLNPFVLIESPTDIARVIDATRQEVLLSAPVVRHQVVAEALRSAIVNRAVQVFIMVSPVGANAPDSYVHALSLLGAHVRVGPDTDPFLIADRATALTGPLLVGHQAVEGEVGSFMLHDPTSITMLASRFVEAFTSAQPFTYVLPGSQ